MWTCHTTFSGAKREELFDVVKRELWRIDLQFDNIFQHQGLDYRAFRDGTFAPAGHDNSSMSLHDLHQLAYNENYFLLDLAGMSLILLWPWTFDVVSFVRSHLILTKIQKNIPAYTIGVHIL